MEKHDLGKHISRKFDHELEDMRNRVLTMGGLVEEQLRNALRALMNQDGELAELVVSRDFQVNRQEVQIDEECTEIIARRQPAASDLRLVMAVIKTVTDLERIGDEAERVGAMALRLIREEGAQRHFRSMEAIGEQVQRMLHGALDAFARLDSDAARRVWLDDSKVDAQYEALVRELITYMMEDPRSIPWVIDAMWAARALERMGDRARNICEYVIYLVKGKDVRHVSAEQMESGVM